MLKSLSSNNRAALDIINIVAGLGLLLSPWYLGYAGETYAAWNAWVVGAAVAVLAALALFAFHQAEEWINLALGLWAVIAPWLLGFATLPAAVGAHVIAGLIVAIVAAGSLWFTTNRPYSTA
jgi:hypothetical protein